jgi:hypothetical protein
MTSCCTDLPATWSRLQSDYLTGTVTVNVTIDSQPVAITFDNGTTFLDAEWLGSPGTTRTWQAYVTPEDLPEDTTVDVQVRIQDDSGPEPVDAFLDAGTITFT